MSHNGICIKRSKHFLCLGRQSTSKSVLRRFHNLGLRRGRCPSSPYRRDPPCRRLAGPRLSSTSCQPVRGSRPLLSQLPQRLQGVAVALPTRQQNSWRLASDSWRCSGVWKRGSKNKPERTSKDAGLFCNSMRVTTLQQKILEFSTKA